MMAVSPTLIFHGCMGFSLLKFDRGFVPASAATATAMVLAKGSSHPCGGPAGASMNGEPGGGFRANAFHAVVLRRNLDVHAPGPAFDIAVLQLRVRDLDPAILDGEPQRLSRLKAGRIRRFLPTLAPGPAPCASRSRV